MTVLHYVEHWLELSAGFVHAHVSRSRHRAVVVSHNATENRTAFPQRPVIRLDRLARRVPPRRWPDARTLALRSIAAATRAELVHVHFGYVAGDVIGLTDRAGLPLVLSLHGSDATALPMRQAGHYDEIVGRVGAVIVPSEFLAAAARSLGFPADRIHIIPAGVDRRFFTATPVPTTPTVAFVGRLVQKKGLDVLLGAWLAVTAAVPGAGLTLLGSGPLESLVPAGDASVRRIHPLATSRGQQVRDVIRSARVVVSPSRTAADGDAESLLLVNLEAQASGRAVVTTRHGGIPEFVDQDGSALVVAENDPDALAAALIRALSEEGLAERLGGAGPTVAARFDVVDSVARVDALYDALVRGR